MRCYIPLANLGDPAPRSAREVLKRHQRGMFVLTALDPQRRGAELALPGIAYVSGHPREETVAAEVRLAKPAAQTSRGFGFSAVQAGREGADGPEVDEEGGEGESGGAGESGGTGEVAAPTKAPAKATPPAKAGRSAKVALAAKAVAKATSSESAGKVAAKKLLARRNRWRKRRQRRCRLRPGLGERRRGLARRCRRPRSRLRRRLRRHQAPSPNRRRHRAHHAPPSHPGSASQQAQAPAHRQEHPWRHPQVPSRAARRSPRTTANASRREPEAAGRSRRGTRQSCVITSNHPSRLGGPVAWRCGEGLDRRAHPSQGAFSARVRGRGAGPCHLGTRSLAPHRGGGLLCRPLPRKPGPAGCLDG